MAIDAERLSNIEIIGSIEPGQEIERAAIDKLLNEEEVTLARGSAFTGRKVTRIYADEHWVLKLRVEQTRTHRDAARWAQQRLERERTLASHHPSKIWFLLRDEGGTTIGNICTRLRPLHRHIDTLLEREQVAHLEQIIDLQLSVTARHALRLDEGLSNYGLDEQGQLYYLDDDLYPEDHLTGLSQGLLAYCRELTSLSSDSWLELGGRIRHAINRHFGDLHWSIVLAEELRGSFVPTAQEAHLRALICALYPAASERKSEAASSSSVSAEVAEERGQDSVSTLTSSKQESDTPADAPAWALLADIHGNAPAFDRVLEALREQGVEQFLILGDTVGYGPHPAECIERVRALGDAAIVIKGNHDHAVALGRATQGFNGDARWAVDWSVQHLSDEARSWLADLPPYYQCEEWLAVHGAPVDRTFLYGYVYRMTYEENLDELMSRGIRLAFHGHTHIQKSYLRSRDDDRECDDVQLSLDGIAHALICPGSVGQPRGRHPGAEYAIYRPQQSSVTFHRLDYDHESTIHDLEMNQFPPRLIERLRGGT